MLTLRSVSKLCVFRSMQARQKIFLSRRYSSSEPSDGEVALVDTHDSAKSIVTSYGDNAPKINTLIALPLTRRPVFPGFMSAVVVKDQRVADEIVSSSEKGGGYVGLFMRSDKGLGIDNHEIVSDISDLKRVGTFAQVQTVSKTKLGTQFLFIGHRRITLDEISNFGPPCTALVTHWKQSEVVVESQTLKAYVNEVVQAVRDLVAMNPLAHEHIQQWVSRVELSDPFKLADFAAAMTTADGEELQKVLESNDAEERLALALELLSKEREVAKLQKEISKQVEDKMSKQQREYFLREQLKSIKQELGLERDDKDELLAKYSERMQHISDPARKVSPEVIRVIDDEMKKLGSLEKNSPEFNVTRSYLDWLTSVPWGLHSEDRLQLAAARLALDADHFGLEEIKKRILEFIAVGKLRKTVAGKIICFIGPPGVGKTSIAKSIATALNKKFYRFSVGGLTDIAEIKGHRRTYIGAMPGKPIQCLKTTGCSNPLILIDEIDKLGRGYSGDPASALLELLDPNQNESFVDHYLDVPVDFSNVLFVCTANDESTIPGPLRDRMEIIRLSGYDIPEKVAIASRYLVPKALREAGLADLPSVTVTFTDEALESLVKKYCRESGVRSLEKHVERIARKISFNAVEQDEARELAASAGEDVAGTSNGSDSSSINSTSTAAADSSRIAESNSAAPIAVHIEVTSGNLETYVGKPKYSQDTIYESSGGPLPVGVVMGLAWNPLGGSPVFIETAAIPTALSEAGGGVNVITGQLGAVMKESVNIAYTFARQFVLRRDASNAFFKCHQLHLHVPEGAVEKDGPSAGVAMACSFISISTNQPLKARVAMTGELSLTGKVLPVGGIKEKILAALRSGANTVILPSANRRDYDELPAYVKDSVTVHFASDYVEVFGLAFVHESEPV